jgi:hypothetical protein
MYMFDRSRTRFHDKNLQKKLRNIFESFWLGEIRSPMVRKYQKTGQGP